MGRSKAIPLNVDPPMSDVESGGFETAKAPRKRYYAILPPLLPAKWISLSRVFLRVSGCLNLEYGIPIAAGRTCL